METPISVNDIVLNALNEHFAQGDDPGIVTGFVLVAECSKMDGRSMVVAYPDEQLPHTGCGLLTYANQWLKDDIQVSFYSDCGEHGE